MTALAAPAASADPGRTKTVPMPFGACQTIIAEMAEETGEPPVDLVSTSDLRKVRIEAADGFVTISCERTSGTMSLSETSRPAAVTASR